MNDADGRGISELGNDEHFTVTVGVITCNGIFRRFASVLKTMTIREVFEAAGFLCYESGTFSCNGAGIPRKEIDKNFMELRINERSCVIIQLVRDDD